MPIDTRRRAARSPGDRVLGDDDALATGGNCQKPLRLIRRWRPIAGVAAGSSALPDGRDRLLAARQRPAGGPITVWSRSWIMVRSEGLDHGQDRAPTGPYTGPGGLPRAGTARLPGHAAAMPLLRPGLGGSREASGWRDRHHGSPTFLGPRDC